MDNPFEDIRREYVNRYSETHGCLLADSYDAFVDRLLTLVHLTLNGTDEGRELVQEAYAAAVSKGLTAEEWSRSKANLMLFLFCSFLDACPQVKHEMAIHLYNELRKENTHD